MERYIAIDNVCAWPNLTLMPDGSIIATIFNQPCHGAWEGDVECWASTDGGRLWHRRGVAAAHEPGTNRMNVAAGLVHNGDLLVIASGWSNRPPAGQPPLPGKSEVLAPWVCRSSDGGRTWQHTERISVPQGAPAIIPFGDIVAAPDGSLAVTFYSWDVDQKRPDNWVYLLRSHDDGRTWADATVLAEGNHNEANPVILDERRWLAAVRTTGGQPLDLFVSDDAGRTWRCEGPLTLPMQHPAHLLKLADGRVLLTYGLRNRGLHGVGARFSENAGQTWGPPMVLVGWEETTDNGYPASVQIVDGTIITAYYASRNASHHRYHMGVVRWRAE